MADKSKEELQKEAAGKSPVVNTPGGEADSGAKLIPESELKGMRGDLDPGDVGYVTLDAKGKPTGAAKKVHPKGDEIVAPVLAVAPRVSDELTTPSGAPITTQMNPEHRFSDPGLDSRLEGYGTGKQPEYQSPVYRNQPISRATGEPVKTPA